MFMKCVSPHLEVVVSSEAWPYPEVSVHICCINTPGPHWPPSPSKQTDQLLKAVGMMKGTLQWPFLPRRGRFKATGKGVCGCISLYLGDFILAPEAGIMERGISMLVRCVRVSFTLNQLPCGI